MRLPYTTWYKKWEGVYKSYNVDILPAYNTTIAAARYKLDDFKFEWRNHKTPANLKFVTETGRNNHYSYNRPAPLDKKASPPYNRQEKESFDESFRKEVLPHIEVDKKKYEVFRRAPSLNLEPVIRTIEF